MQKQDIQVFNDPNLHSNSASIQAQYDLGKQLLSSINNCLSLIERMEVNRVNFLKQNTSESLLKEKEVYNLEKQLMDIHLTGARMDIFRNPAQILERLLTISKESQTMGADFAPTTQQTLVYQALNSQLKKVELSYLQLKL